MSEQNSRWTLVPKLDRQTRKLRRERGAELVEFNLVLIPMMALIFLSVDAAWAIYAKAALQEAVREGVRYGVTGAPATGLCLDASIKKVVTSDSFGILNSTNQSDISIAYYSPAATGTNLAGQAGATAGGNILQVSVNGVSLKLLAPFFVSSSPMSLSASATDVLESSPNNTPPCE